MDSDEEELVVRMCCGAATTVLCLVVSFMQQYQSATKSIPREPTPGRDLSRNVNMYRIINGSTSSCLDNLRMGKAAFFNLAQIMRDANLLKDTIHVPIEEQLAMFLHIVGHTSRNRVMRSDFVRSGETVSRYFNKVLGAICMLRDRFMKQTSNQTPPEISNDPELFPYFVDCIGLIDVTHIDAMLPTKHVARFRGRKGVTQNVLAASTPNKRFTYVVAGWEGSANDFTLLKDALSLPPPHGLQVYEGKYYLCDVGYTTMRGFMSPYRSVRYHLKELSGCTPSNRKELFNLRHSTLRTNIESAFVILKNRFKILSAKPNYPFPSQVDIVLACTILHNYIAATDPHDKFLNEDVKIMEEDGDVVDEDDDSIFDFSEQVQEREEWKQLRDQIAWDMWVDYCYMHRAGDTRESEI